MYKNLGQVYYKNLSVKTSIIFISNDKLIKVNIFVYMISCNLPIV